MQACLSFANYCRRFPFASLWFSPRLSPSVVLVSSHSEQVSSAKTNKAHLSQTAFSIQGHGWTWGMACNMRP